MTRIIRLFLTFLAFFVCLSCSSNESKNPIIGIWKLTTWTAGIPFNSSDGNNRNKNFLDYTTCPVNEQLRFDEQGTVTSVNTFNPEITIRLSSETSDGYSIHEICAEGQIGFSSEYEHPNPNVVTFNGAEGVYMNGELRVIYPKAIKIYNESLTKVIELRDLLLVYTKIE